MNLGEMIWLAKLESLAFGKMVVEGILFQHFYENWVPFTILFDWTDVIGAI